MGSYTPPARDAIELQYAGNYTPPARDAIELSYQPPTPPPPPTGLTITQILLTEIDAQCDPPSEGRLLKWYIKTETGDWELKETTSDNTHAYTDLLQGNHYYVTASQYRTDLGMEGDKADPLDVWTSYELDITEVRDQDNNLLQGALVIALSEEDALSLVQASENGDDLPTLGIMKANKTDSNGTCKIKVPGGKGKVTVFFVVSDPNVGGDIKVHIATEETG